MSEPSVYTLVPRVWNMALVTVIWRGYVVWKMVEASITDLAWFTSKNMDRSDVSQVEGGSRAANAHIYCLLGSITPG